MLLKNTFSIPKELIISIFGHRSVWKRHRKIKALSSNLISNIEFIDKFENSSIDEDDHNSPLFILSAGWRSGSTLLQRLVCSKDNRFIWGEPYGDTGLLQCLSHPLRQINKEMTHPNFFHQNFDTKKSMREQWIANMYPSLSDLKSAQRAYMDKLFLEPAVRVGYESWGIKEVRLNAEHAYFLKWLYPKCKIIFLVRNPIDAYHSYAKYKRWYHIRPSVPIFNVNAFSTHWNNLALSFKMHSNSLDAKIVKYEDLINQTGTLQAIEDYLDIEIDPSVLDIKLKKDTNMIESYRVVRGEEWILKRRLRKTALQFGYDL